MCCSLFYLNSQIFFMFSSLPQNLWHFFEETNKVCDFIFLFVLLIFFSVLLICCVVLCCCFSVLLFCFSVLLLCNLCCSMLLFSGFVVVSYCLVVIISFISTWHHNITNEWQSFLSLLSERRKMRASENAILSLGVGSNPGPFAPESWVLPCAPLHIRSMLFCCSLLFCCSVLLFCVVVLCCFIVLCCCSVLSFYVAVLCCCSVCYSVVLLFCVFILCLFFLNRFVSGFLLGSLMAREHIVPNKSFWGNIKEKEQKKKKQKKERKLHFHQMAANKFFQTKRNQQRFRNSIFRFI